MVILKPSYNPYTKTLVHLFLLTSLLIGGILTQGCKSPDISDSQNTPIDTAANGFATLRLTNRIAQDPGAITFYLYPKEAVELTNASNAVLVGKVETDATTAFKVPAGSWKIAYLDRTKNLYQMRDEASGSLEWLRSDFKKDGDYSLILNSDGNRTIWVPSYTTVPPIDKPL